MADSKYNNSPVSFMVRSGARGSKSQIVQLGGIRGQLLNIQNLPLEQPVSRNYREGVSPLEFYLGSHAGRRSMCEKKLLTAPAGDFTRLMIEAAYPLIIKGEDCGSEEGLHIYSFPKIDLPEFKKVPDLSRRLIGRTEVNGNIIDERRAKELEKIQTPVSTRSVLTCRGEKLWGYGALCQKCYGWDLSKRRLPDIGLPVGILAGQSIGERGTQLTMRTFHTGGVGGGVITEGLPRMKKIFGNGEVSLAVYHIDDSGDADLSPGGKTDQWKLLLATVKLSAGNTLPNVTRLKKQNGEPYTVFAKLADILKSDGLQGLLTVLSYEAHIIYKEAVAEKHFEVITKGMMGVTSGDYTQLTGIRNVPFLQPGFLAAASFQRALQVFAKASLKGQCDDLQGYKERLILGKKMIEDSENGRD